MSVVVRAHFDGKNIVPDEPVDLPIDQPLEAQVSIIDADREATDIARRRAALKRVVSRAVPANIPLEALRRENMYEDRT